MEIERTVADGDCGPLRALASAGARCRCGRSSAAWRAPSPKSGSGTAGSPHLSARDGECLASRCDALDHRLDLAPVGDRNGSSSFSFATKGIRRRFIAKVSSPLRRITRTLRRLARAGRSCILSRCNASTQCSTASALRRVVQCVAMAMLPDVFGSLVADRLSTIARPADRLKARSFPNELHVT